MTKTNTNLNSRVWKWVSINMLITVIAFLSLPLQAENYPYRSDYLWVTVPDHADWLYQTGENATVEVQF